MHWGKAGAALATILAALAVAAMAFAAQAPAYSVKTTGMVGEKQLDSEGGCEKITTFTWADLHGADSYTLKMDDTGGFSFEDTYGEPYEFDGQYGNFPPVGKGSHRIVLTYQGGGVGGCQGDDVSRFTVKKFVANYCEEAPSGLRAREPVKEEQGCKSQIVGTATEPDGAPIKGVHIAISGEGGEQTNQAGAFAAKVKQGRHTVTAPKGFCVKGGGKCDRSKSVEVKAGMTESVNFVRSASFSVKGTITDEFGNGLDGVRVRMTGPDDASDTTKGDGTYRVEVDEPGTYELTAHGNNGDHGPYEIYYIRLDSGAPSSGTAADVTLGDTENSQTVDWELDRRLQIRVDAPAVLADGVSHYPLAIRVLTQRNDPVRDAKMDIDPAVQTDGHPRAVICSDKSASRPLWPTINPDGSVAPVGLQRGIEETMTNNNGIVALDLFAGNEPGSFTISGGRTGDAASTFFTTIPFASVAQGSYDAERVKHALQDAAGTGGTTFGSEEAILELVALARGLSAAELSSMDAVPVKAGGKSGLAFFRLGSPPVEGSGGTLAPAGNIFVFDDALLNRIQAIPNLPTLADWAAGETIAINRADRRTFVQWPLPTVQDGGFGTCLQGAPADTMTFVTHSPAHLMLTDSQGNRIGFDGKGRHVSDAAGGALRVGGDDAVVVPTGSYKVSLVGTGKGPVTLEARSGAALSVAQFKSKKGGKGTFKTAGADLLPKRFKFAGHRVSSVDGLPIEVKGLPRKLRVGKRTKLRLKVKDAFGDPVPFPVLNTAGAAGSTTAYGDVGGKIVTKLRPRKAGKAKLTVSGGDVLPERVGVRVRSGRHKKR